MQRRPPRVTALLRQGGGDTERFPGSLSLPYPSERRGGRCLRLVGDCIFAVCGEVSGVGLPAGLDRLRPATHHPRRSEGPQTWGCLRTGLLSLRAAPPGLGWLSVVSGGLARCKD